MKFPYDDAIRQLKVFRDEAQREAEAWAYFAVNESYRGEGYVRQCHAQRAVQKYLKAIFDAAIDYTEQEKRKALEAALKKVTGEIKDEPLVETARTPASVP
jgi:hypothetical protein